MLRVMDAPGYYAAFPWGVTRGKRGRPERAATPLAHALYILLSLPRIFHAWSFIRPRRRFTEQYTEGLHPERPARGAVLYTGLPRPCIEHKGPPSTKNMHTKDDLPLQPWSDVTLGVLQVLLRSSSGTSSPS